MLLRQCRFTWGCVVEALQIYVRLCCWDTADLREVVLLRHCRFTWGSALLREALGSVEAVHFYVRQSTFSRGLSFCFWGTALSREVSGYSVEELRIYLRFHVNVAVTVKNILFWYVMPCSPVENYGVLQYVNLFQTKWRHIPQDRFFSVDSEI